MLFTSTGKSLGIRPVFAALVSLFCLATPRLAAHPVAQGTMVVHVSAQKIRLEVIVSMEEVLVQSALSSQPRGDSSVEQLCRRHGEYLMEHVRLSADGKPLSGRLTVITPPSSRNTRPVYEFEYPLAAPPAKIHVEQDVLNEFNYAPGNRWEATFVVRVLQAEALTMEGFLLTSREPLVVTCDWRGGPPAAAANKWRLFGQYVRHGIAHILTGYDHLLFIGGLVLAVTSLWDLIKVITAFTLAHSITLTLSVLDLLRLSPSVVEPMIALSIVFVATQNIFWPESARGWGRLAIAFFFGLFHGLGFAGGLLEAMQGMSGLTIGLAIMAFSVGVEIGHQIVIVPVFVVRKILLVKDEGRSRAAGYFYRYGSAAIACAGVFYLVTALRF